MIKMDKEDTRKYLGKIWNILDIVGSRWDAWILYSDIRLSTVSETLVKTEHVPGTKMYEYVRTNVDFTGTSQNTHTSLYYLLNRASGFHYALPAFTSTFLETIEGKLHQENSDNSNYVLDLLSQKYHSEKS